MTLLRELIDIPERVHRSDFVLRLTEGVTRPIAGRDEDDGELWRNCAGIAS